MLKNVCKCINVNILYIYNLGLTSSSNTGNNLHFVKPRVKHKYEGDNSIFICSLGLTSLLRILLNIKIWIIPLSVKEITTKKIKSPLDVCIDFLCKHSVTLISRAHYASRKYDALLFCIGVVSTLSVK